MGKDLRSMGRCCKEIDSRSLLAWLSLSGRGCRRRWECMRNYEIGSGSCNRENGFEGEMQGKGVRSVVVIEV